MSKLSAFLNPVYLQEEKEIIISKRFLDEKGKPVPFKIRSITQEENEAIIRKCTTRIKSDGQYIEKFDSGEFSRRLVVLATVFPDFTDSELCSKYGVLDPTLVPGKMLLSGEFNQLMRAITNLSQLNDNEEETAKN